MGLFAVGVLAVVVIMVMFASGSHDLPLWLNLTAMLAPLGFAVGMVGVAVDARRSSRALARATADQDSDPGSQPRQPRSPPVSSRSPSTPTIWTGPPSSTR